MPLYMLQVKTVSRAGSGSIVAGAAYRSGTRLREHERGHSAVAASAHLAGARLEEERGGTVHDFRGKAVQHAEVMLPPGAPETFRDRETLFNAVEAAERRRDARLGRELVVALPRELSDGDNLGLVRNFVHGSLVERGMCADFAIHAPTASDGLRQQHAHILTTTREVGPDGFGAKVRAWDKRDLVTSLRSEWADCCNTALEMAGREERVSHERLEVQLERALERGDFEAAARLDREPGVHLGPAAAAMERQGIATDVGDELRASQAENRERAGLYEMVRELAADVPEAPARFLELRRETGDPRAAFEGWAGWALGALERVRELAHEIMEPVRDLAVSAWDNLVSAMSPFSDFHTAEREREERELEQDPVIEAMDELAREDGIPSGCEDLAAAALAEREPEDDLVAAMLAEMEHDDRERGHEQERDLEHEM